MANPLPSKQTSGFGGRVARNTLNVGVATFNKMFPTLGRAIGRFTEKPNDDKQQTAQQINAALVSNNIQFEDINRKLEEQNKILERIFDVQRQNPTVPGAPRPGSVGEQNNFDIPIPEADRRSRPATPQQRPGVTSERPRSRSWLRRFLTFMKRKSPRLFKAVARRIAAAAAGVAVPGPGWLLALISAASFLVLAYDIYQVYKEFQESNSEEEDEDILDNLPSEQESEQAERELIQEIERQLYSDVSEIGETQNLNESEQRVLDAQREQAERNRQRAGLQGNLEDPRRQDIMQRLARQRELAARPGQLGRAAQQAVRNIEQELENYNRSNPISEADSQLITPPQTTTTRRSREEVVNERMAERNSQAQIEINSARPQADAQESAMTPRGSVGAFMDEEASFAPRPQSQVVDQATRTSADPFSGEYEKITFEADKITFQGMINQLRQQQGIPLTSREAEVVRSSLPPPSAGFRTAQFRDRLPETPDQVMSSLAASTAAAAPSAAATAGMPGAAAAPSPGAAPGQPQAARSVGGGATGSAAAAMQFFISKGWTPAQAAGFAANLQVESNFNPAAVGDSGRAYGIAQWHPDRQRNFQAWSGKDIRGSTFEEQLGFIHYELTQGREKRAGAMIRQATTPTQAAAVIDQYYERSNGHARPRRMQLAETYAASNPAVPGNQMAQAPSSNPAMLAEASTERVTADREQARTNQRIIAEFNQQASSGTDRRQTNDPRSREQTSQNVSGEVALRTRILNVFNQLNQAS